MDSLIFPCLPLQKTHFSTKVVLEIDYFTVMGSQKKDKSFQDVCISVFMHTKAIFGCITIWTWPGTCALGPPSIQQHLPLRMGLSGTAPTLHAEGPNFNPGHLQLKKIR